MKIPIHAQLLISLSLLIHTTAAFFCSAYCSPNSCTGITKTQCTGCDFPFILQSTSCVIDTTTPYTIAAEQATITLNNTASTTCGVYSFKGSYPQDQIIVLTGPVISSFHVSVRLIIWVFMSDGWKNTADFVVGTLVSTGQIISLEGNAHQTEQDVCGSGSKVEWLMKFDQEFTHSSTTVPVVFHFTANHQGTPAVWGIKDYMILAAGCDNSCLNCVNGSSNGCTSCTNTSHKLSGGTCSQQCLTSYGQVSTDPSLCILCNSFCLTCYDIDTNCSSCVQSGFYQAYLLAYNNSCEIQCPDYYTENSNTHTCIICDNAYCLECSNLTLTECYQCNDSAYLHEGGCVEECPEGFYEIGVVGNNSCGECDVECELCDGNSSNCQECKDGFYLDGSTCDSTCPSGFSKFLPNKTCIDCSIHCITATISVYLSSPNNLFIDFTFSKDFTLSSSERPLFQTLTFDSGILLGNFDISYLALSSTIYRISLIPKSGIDLNNVLLNVDVNAFTSQQYVSADGYELSPTVMALTGSYFWNYTNNDPDGGVIPDDVTPEEIEESLIEQLEGLNNRMNEFMCLKGVQEIKKTGIFAFIAPGVQLSSTILLSNVTLDRTTYEVSRFWGSFVYFEVPAWLQDATHDKYLITKNVASILQNQKNQTRLLVTSDTSSEKWVFSRTGHNLYFIFDAYIPALMIVLVWLGALLLRKCNGLKGTLIRTKFYTILHAVHEVCMFYILMGICLQLIFWKKSGVLRWFSFSLALLFALYYLIYQMYIFYRLIPYANVTMLSEKFDRFVELYSYFLMDVRFEEYGRSDKWKIGYFFRPLNYQLATFVRLTMIIVCLPLFQGYDYAISTILVVIQCAEIIRFMLTWPYVKLWRNLYHLSLEILLLSIFTIHLYEELHQKNTNSSNLGILSFALISLYNIAFMTLFFLSLVIACKYSNEERVKYTRSVFYEDLLEEYERSYELEKYYQRRQWENKRILNELEEDEKDLKEMKREGEKDWDEDQNQNQNQNQKNGNMLDSEMKIERSNCYFRFLRRLHGGRRVISQKNSFKENVQILVHKGNLIKHKPNQFWQINFLIEEYKIEEKGLNQYLLTFMKVPKITMCDSPTTSRKYNVIPHGKRSGQNIRISQEVSEYYFKIISHIYNYYRDGETESVTVKTYLFIDQNDYEANQEIGLSCDNMNQEIEVRVGGGSSGMRKERLQKILQGFPISMDFIDLLTKN